MRRNLNCTSTIKTLSARIQSGRKKRALNRRYILYCINNNKNTYNFMLFILFSFFFFFLFSRDESAQKITVFILYCLLHLCMYIYIRKNYVVCVFMLSIAIKNLLFFFIYMTMETRKKNFKSTKIL